MSDSLILNNNNNESDSTSNTVLKKENNEIVNNVFNTSNVQKSLFDSSEFLLGYFLYNSSNIARKLDIITYNCRIFFLCQSVKINLPYNNFILFNCCTEALSTAFASNRKEYFFKYSYLCINDKYIANVFSLGWHRKTIISNKFELNFFYGFGLCLNTNLFYTENDKNILFNKYNVISMINPFNYRYFFSTYIELGIQIYAIYFLFRLIDLDNSFVCNKPVSNMIRNLIKSRFEKLDTDNTINNVCDINATNIDTGFLITCDIREIFSFFKSNINNFGYNGDW